jgi:hypothetical protein
MKKGSQYRAAKWLARGPHKKEEPAYVGNRAQRRAAKARQRRGSGQC